MLADLHSVGVRQRSEEGCVSQDADLTLGARDHVTARDSPQARGGCVRTGYRARMHGDDQVVVGPEDRAVHACVV